MQTSKPPPEMKYQHLITAFVQDAWMITEDGFSTVSRIIEERSRGHIPTPEELQAQIGNISYGSDLAQMPGGMKYYGSPSWMSGEEVVNGVAVIALHGAMINRAGMFDSMSGATSPQQFARAVTKAANDPNVREIVLSIDSPGGTVSGTQTAADAVLNASKKKHVIAVIDEMAASAAQWVASGASRTIINPNGIAGSISVIGTHADWSARYAMEGVKQTILRTGEEKALGQPTESMDGRAVASRMRDMTVMHNQFVSSVATNRKLKYEMTDTPYGPKATADWATGRIFIGKEAVTVGLADAVGTLESVLEELGVLGSSSTAQANSGARAESETIIYAAETSPENATSSESPVNPTGSLESQTMPSADAALIQKGAAMPELLEPTANPTLEGRIAELEAQNAVLTATAASATALSREATQREALMSFTVRATTLGLEESYGADLMSLHGANPEATERLMEALAERQISAGAEARILAEMGSRETGTVADTALARAELGAKALMVKHPGMSKGDALNTVFKADKDLANAYLEETRAASRR